MRVLKPSLKLKVRGFARSWPEGPAVTNVELLLRHPDTADKPKAVLEALSERITSGFGFKARFMARTPGTSVAPSEATSESLALGACKQALQGKKPSAFVLGSTTSSRYTGSQAAAVLGQLEITAPAYEMKAGCSTSIASLSFAEALLQQGYPDVLVSCAETLSKVIHPHERDTWFGLADGGAAIWLESLAAGEKDFSAAFEVERILYSTDGRHVDLFTTPGILPPDLNSLEQGGYWMSGDNTRLRELAEKHYLELISEILPTPEDRESIRWVLSHQVSRSLIDGVKAKAGLAGELIWDAQEYGNIGGASVLFSFAHALENKIFSSGDRILFMSVGGGLSFAAQVWKKL